MRIALGAGDQAHELLVIMEIKLHAMTTTSYHSALTSFGISDLRAILLEPFLIVAVSVFWIVTLPFAAVSLLGVKIWETVSVFSRANPLILRRGRVVSSDSAPAHGSSASRT